MIVQHWSPPTHDEDTYYWEKTVDDIRETNSAIKHSYRKLKTLYKIAMKAQDDEDNDIPMPTFGQVDKVYNINGIHTLPRFDNESMGHIKENNTKAYYCETLYQYWCKLIEFVSAQNISEKGAKDILASTLYRAPYDVYLINKDQPIKEIILQLKERFGSFPTQADYEDQLINFQREIKEPITIAMNRFEFIIRNYYRGDPELNKILELRCRNEVKYIARPHAQEALARKEAEEGNRPFTYQRRLKIIKEEEEIIERSKRVIDTPMNQIAL